MELDRVEIVTLRKKIMDAFRKNGIRDRPYPNS